MTLKVSKGGREGRREGRREDSSSALLSGLSRKKCGGRKKGRTKEGREEGIVVAVYSFILLLSIYTSLRHKWPSSRVR